MPIWPRIRFALLVASTLGLIYFWIAALAGRWWLSHPTPLALTIMVLPHLWFLLALACCFCVVFLRHRLWSSAKLIALALSALLLWAPSWVGSSEIGGGPRLTTLNWNVARLGEFAPWAEKRRAERETLACVASAIERTAPDVVALLEISRRRLVAVERELGLTCETTDYFGTGVPRFGGLAVCVPRAGPWKIINRRSLELPPDWHYVFTEIKRGSTTVNVIAVHFRPYGEKARAGVDGLTSGQLRPVISLAREIKRTTEVQREQAERLLEVIGDFRDPTVVMGDFNGTRDTAVHVRLRTRLVDSWERGGWGFGATRWLWGWLPLRIDYIYASDRFANGGADVLADPCSDHGAVVAELSLRDKAEP